MKTLTYEDKIAIANTYLKEEAFVTLPLFFELPDETLMEECLTEEDVIDWCRTLLISDGYPEEYISKESAEISDEDLEAAAEYLDRLVKNIDKLDGEGTSDELIIKHLKVD